MTTALGVGAGRRDSRGLSNRCVMSSTPARSTASGPIHIPSSSAPLPTIRLFTRNKQRNFAVPRRCRLSLRTSTTQSFAAAGIGLVAASSSISLRRGVKTAIWCGEAGIQAIASEKLGDCSLTLADPTTEIWWGVMGKPISS
jgi:hypothetical protein